MPKKIVWLLLGVALGGWSCGGGGCGEDNNKVVDTRPVVSGAKGAPGSGTVDNVRENAKTRGPNPEGSRFDTAGSHGSSNDAADQAQEAAGQQPQKLAGPQTIFDVDPPGFSRVLKSTPPSLVIVYAPECKDCGVVMPALRTLSQELRGQFEFYRIDATAVGASGVLPAGTLQPTPAFVLYQGGKPISSRAGLPFAREAAQKDRPEEPLPEYQRRLYRWFRDALTQKNLKFGAT